MKWSHLPEPGGIYAQDPRLLDGFQVIFSLRAEYEEEKEKKDEAERDADARRARQKNG